MIPIQQKLETTGIKEILENLRLQGQMKGMKKIIIEIPKCPWDDLKIKMKLFQNLRGLRPSEIFLHKKSPTQQKQRGEEFTSWEKRGTEGHWEL